ncbi:hypothetical protein BD560DRAFT_386364 [Blakeslea trispora]|nr:hypothetical protein BD560DRAFT_386364 [Blakeslea trispora]
MRWYIVQNGVFLSYSETQHFSAYFGYWSCITLIVEELVTKAYWRHKRKKKIRNKLSFVVHVYVTTLGLLLKTKNYFSSQKYHVIVCCQKGI